LDQIRKFGDAEIGEKGSPKEAQYFEQMKDLTWQDKVSVVASQKAFRQWFDMGSKSLWLLQTSTKNLSLVPCIAQDSVAVYKRSEGKMTFEAVEAISSIMVWPDPDNYERNDDATTFVGGLQSKLELHVGQVISLNNSIPSQGLTKGESLRLKSIDSVKEEIVAVLERDATDPSARTFVITPMTMTAIENAVPSVCSALLENGHYREVGSITRAKTTAQNYSSTGAYFGFARRQYPFSTKSVLMVMSTRGMSIDGGVIGIAGMHNDSVLVLIGRSDNFVFAFPPKSHVEWDKLRKIEPAKYLWEETLRKGIPESKVGPLVLTQDIINEFQKVATHAYKVPHDHSKKLDATIERQRVIERDSAAAQLSVK